MRTCFYSAENSDGAQCFPEENTDERKNKKRVRLIWESGQANTHALTFSSGVSASSCGMLGRRRRSKFEGKRGLVKAGSDTHMHAQLSQQPSIQ